MPTGEQANEALERAEQYLNGNRVEEARVYALIAIARQLDRIAVKIGAKS